MKKFRDNHPDGKFTKWFVKYWKGTYEDLKEQFLTIRLEDWKRCCGNTPLGEAKINLYELAIGNIQQRIDIELHENSSKPGKKSKHLVTGTLTFLCYFQEVFEYRLHFYNWKGTFLSLYFFLGRDLIAADSNGTSDPYLVFKLPARFKQFFVAGDFGRSDMSQMFSGAYFGRSCKTHHIMNTLFPRWDDAGEMKFHGIRSELENAELLIDVYDWDRASADDLIGKASVPLRGLIDYGYLHTGLKLPKMVTKRLPNGTVQKVEEIEPAGELEGFVEIEQLPAHEQYGDIFELLEGHRYLAVHIENCVNLQATDSNGLTDAFVVVEWNGMKQQTSIQFQNLNPSFDETLYFPVRVAREDAETLAQFNQVRVNVFDFDEAGNDFIGGSFFTLHDITVSESEKHGAYKSRTYKNQQLKLVNAGDTGKVSTISLKSWFIQDLDENLIIPETVPKKAIKDLPEEYRTREKVWLKKIPSALVENMEYQIAATDETCNVRFIPTFINPMGPPREMQSPYRCLRLVHCMTFESDSDAFYGIEDVWASPNFFLSQGKGDQEEHAILLCNLFLGLEMDAYVCLGRTKSGIDHAWVMTRDIDGSITFWESTNNKSYLLTERWEGDPAEVEAEKLAQMSKKQAQEYEKQKKLLAKQKKKKRKKKNVDQSVAIHFDDDEVLDASEIASASQQAQREISGGERIQHVALATTSTSITGLSMGTTLDRTTPAEYDLGLKPAHLPYSTLTVVFNNQNLWANAQQPDPSKIKYDLTDKYSWVPFIDGSEGFSPDIEPFYQPMGLSRKLPLGRVNALIESIERELFGAFVNWRHGRNLPKTHFYKDMTPILREGLKLMEQVAVASTDPIPLEPEEEEEDNQSTDTTHPVADSSVPSTAETGDATSSQGEVETNPDSIQLTSLDSHQTATISSDTNHATSSTTLHTNPGVIAPPKKTHTSEYEKASLQLATWKGSITSQIPQGYRFKGIPVSFCYTDHRRIRKYLMDKYDFHHETDPKALFVIAAHAEPYFNNVTAIWVFIGKLVPV